MGASNNNNKNCLGHELSVDRTDGPVRLRLHYMDTETEPFDHQKAAERKKVQLHCSTTSKWAGTLHPRRTSRPLIAKPRVAKEEALKSAKKAALSKIDEDRIKRLEKLQKRQEAAGNAAAAEATNNQIAEIRMQQ